jgi:hypothetical protein|tara:strand:+ start:1605 stop:2051 length:447 start_codon:yes stop_codon:yes gene_type:complete
MFMKLKNFKKKIETVLFKRVCDEKKYIIFSSSIKNNSFSSNSYNILNYSLNNSLQKFLTKPLVNNFLKSSFFSTVSDFNIFFKNLKTNTNLIYFIKFKNLYIFNFDSDFKTKFDSININPYSFILRLQKLFLNWLPLLKLVVKDSIKK